MPRSSKPLTAMMKSQVSVSGASEFLASLAKGLELASGTLPGDYMIEAQRTRRRLRQRGKSRLMVPALLALDT